MILLFRTGSTVTLCRDCSARQNMMVVEARRLRQAMQRFIDIADPKILGYLPHHMRPDDVD